VSKGINGNKATNFEFQIIIDEMNHYQTLKDVVRAKLTRKFPSQSSQSEIKNSRKALELKYVKNWKKLMAEGWESDLKYSTQAFISVGRGWAEVTVAWRKNFSFNQPIKIDA